MDEIETASWIETRTRWGQYDGERKFSEQHWLRTMPPAEARRIDFGDSWTHVVYDARGNLHTTSTEGAGVLYPIREPFDAGRMMSRVLFEPAVELAASGTLGPRWRQEPVEFEGRSCVRWSREYARGAYRVAETVWTEPRTHRVVRKEVVDTDPRTGRRVATTVCERYVYNEALPEGIFDMPEGKPIRKGKPLKPGGDEWASLRAEVKRAVRTAIVRSDAGWRNADFEAFRSVWRFDAASPGPREQDWKQRLRRQNGLWRSWVSEVETARTTTCVLVPVAAGTFMPLPRRRRTLEATVRLRAKANASEAEWEGTARFYLRRIGRSYRIVSWECPFEEIRRTVRR